jgi:hypothetical protein
LATRDPFGASHCTAELPAAVVFEARYRGTERHFAPSGALQPSSAAAPWTRIEKSYPAAASWVAAEVINALGKHRADM